MSYTLTFSNLIGEFVTDKELLGAQDPYVVFEAGGRKSQTKAIKSAGAGTCEWKETYTLHEFSPKSSSTLDVTVYNHNTLRPDGTLGSGTVNLNNLGESQLSGSGDRVTVPLTDKKGKNVGALKFIIHGGGFSGSGSTRSSGYGTGTGAGAGAAGAGAAGLGHTGTGHHGHTGSGTGTGQVTGVGAGSNYGTAKAAADKAAHENRDVTIQNSSGTAAGRPTNTGTGYDESSRSTGSGVTSGTTGTGAGIKASGVRGLEGQAGEVIDRKYYTGFEDRPQEQALVEQFREHNPYAKQYETTVQHTGRERLVGSSIEALGTNERVVGSDHHVHAHPHDHIARALPKGAIAERPGGEGWVQGKAGPVCDSSTFEVTGDRTVDKERVTNLREHREFEKEFEVKTAYTGERQLQRGGETEQLNRERVLLDEKNKVACDGHPTVDAQTGGHTGTGPSITGGHHHGHGHHHTGTGVTGGSTGTGIGSRGTETGTGSTGYGAGSGTTGTGYGSGTGATGTGSGYGSNTGATGTGTGATGTGSGYGSGTGTGAGTGTGTGTSGYGSGAGTGSGYGSGTGTGTTGQSGTTGMTTTQKIASLVPGTEANKEKKAAQGNY